MYKKHILSFLLCLFIILPAYCQQEYIVKVSTSLNVRSEPHETAQLIGTIENGKKVTVHEFTNNWAKISYEYKTGYVNKQYIYPVNTPSASSSYKKNGIKYSYDFDLGVFKSLNLDKEWIYVILVLSAILLIIRLKRGDEPLEGGINVFNWILFFCVCLLEIAYVLSLQGDVIWFCMPDNVGWLYTVINFLIFGFLVYNQLMCLLNTLLDVQYNSCASFNWKWGLYSWPIAVIAAILCGFFFQEGLIFVGGLFLVAQIIQIVIVFMNVLPKGGIGHSLLCTFIYLLGSIATAVILAHFLVLLIIVLIGFFILSVISKMQESESNKRCSNCSHFSGSYCYNSGKTIYSPSSKVCDNYS